MKMLRILAVAALASSATLAMADEKVVTEDGVATFATFKPANIRAEIGTTGYGGAISWSANPYVALTLGYNGGNISWTDELKIDGTKYDLDMDNKAVYLNAEIRPFANWFYMAAGVGYLDNDYEVSKRGNSIEFNGNTYVSADGINQGSVQGKVSYKENFAPYIGFGISPAITSRVGLFGEIGAYYTGNPSVDLNANNLAGALLGQQGINAAIQEQENKIRDEVKYEFFPVAKVGLSVRF